MENFTNALAPIRNAYVQAQTEFILNNYQEAFDQITEFNQTTAPLVSEMRDIQWNLKQSVNWNMGKYTALFRENARLQEIQGLMKQANRKLTMAPAMYELAQTIVRKMRKESEAHANYFIESYAAQSWAKREVTITKAMKKKGLDLQNLEKMELQSNPGYQFQMFLQDIAGKTAHARAILVLGTIKVPHMRFICT